MADHVLAIGGTIDERRFGIQRDRDRAGDSSPGRRWGFNLPGCLIGVKSRPRATGANVRYVPIADIGLEIGFPVLQGSAPVRLAGLSPPHRRTRSSSQTWICALF